MKFKRDVAGLYRAAEVLESAVDRIIKKVRSVCDFELYLADVSGDGWCIGSEVDGKAGYMKLLDVLDIIEKNGRFTEEDWKPFG